MRSMFQMGFDRQIFTERHPSMGLSFNDISTWWKENYPRLKEDIRPLRDGQLPTTTSTTPLRTPIPAPAPSSGPSTALVVGGLALAGLAGYYFLAKRPFGIRK